MGINLTIQSLCRNNSIMTTEILKIIVHTNIFFSILITLYIIFSKKNEPSKYPEKFCKTYTLKPRKKISHL